MKVKIHKFEDCDFGFWRIQIGDYLYQKKLYEPLVEKKREVKKQEDCNLQDQHALGVLIFLAKNVANSFVNVKTTYHMIRALCNMYENLSTLNNMIPVFHLVNMKIKGGWFNHLDIDFD